MRRVMQLLLIGGLTIVGCGDGGYSELSQQSGSSSNSSTPVRQSEPELEPEQKAKRVATAPAEPKPREPVNKPTVDPAIGEVVTPGTPDGSESTSPSTAQAANPNPKPKRKGPLPRAATHAPRSVVGSVLGARDRNTALSNGKQLATMMMPYESNARFPRQAIVGDDGTPLLSWRVKVLQKLDKNLYNAFKLDEPWDSPANKKLLANMPSVFKAGYAFEDEGMTVVKVVVSDDSMFPDPNSAMGKRGMQIKQASDGTTSTLLFVFGDPNQAVPWTKPEDIVFDPENPQNGLAGPDGTIIAAFCDGSIKRLRDLDDATVKAIVTRRGREVIRLP